MINKTHHELKIAYLRDRLKNYPRGTFGMHRGKRVVYITYDPTDPDVTSVKRKRFICDSKEGLVYSELLREAYELERELKELLFKWEETYKGMPRDITFPLERKTRSFLDKELYFSSESDQNPLKRSNKIIYKGQYLRSKNELLACQALDKMGYEFKSEIALTPPGFKTFFPDVIFYIREIEKPVALEVDGAMDEKGYRYKAYQRADDYFDAGLMEFKDVVFFRLTDPYSIDMDRFNAVVNAAILANIDDLNI
ncbi:MAG: hypothetical protein J5685_02295 [Clostridiales bacterium]|nr:hypothetical protein [Clostridiales bacterium]